MKKPRLIPRDISWLSFNARVLQEAADPTVPLKDRIHFLAIHSNNLDEFFSIRVPALKEQIKLETKNEHANALENTREILNEVYAIVGQQQTEFSRIWRKILQELNKRKIFLLNELELSPTQKNYIHNFYETEISPNIIPLFVESLPPLTTLWARNSFLGVVMHSKKKSLQDKYAIIEVPTNAIGRFITLPSKGGEQNIILLEDVIRFHLPYIFSSFGYDSFEGHLFKVTQDAEIDMDSELAESYIQRIESGVKKRRKSKPICFLYDKDMDSGLLEYLIRWLNISKQDSMIPRGRIRNFRDFLHFPAKFAEPEAQQKPFTHPDLARSLRVSDAVLKRDILLCTPYHSFHGVIDMLREAAMDSDVTSIKITAYRLAKHSMICNALINAARNGKKVHVVIEIKATYDEEANLNWKNKLEEEGVRVSIGVPNLKIHAKMCIIKKTVKDKIIHYGFIGTGNLNEETALVYADYFLLTSDKRIMKDVMRIFKALKGSSIDLEQLKTCKTLLVSPTSMRSKLIGLIDREIKNKVNGKHAEIKLDINALSDDKMIEKLYEAGQGGVKIRMIIRSIMCAVPKQKIFKKPLRAISIVDKFLEHSRAWVFDDNGEIDTYISSADWMGRNLDYRLEVAVPILDPNIKQQLLDILTIKFNDNVKARVLDNDLSNLYVKHGKKKIRSQIEIYRYLRKIAQTKTKFNSKKGS